MTSLSGREKRGTSPSPRVVFDSPCVAFGRATFPLPAPLDSGLRRNDGWGAGTTGPGAFDCGYTRRRVSPFSYQWRMPAPAGMRRHEEPELWLGTSNRHGGFSRAPPRPQRGTSPSPRVVFDRATLAAGGTETNEGRGGLCQAPTPTPAGDKPLASRSLRPHYIFSFRDRPSVYSSAGFAGGVPASRLTGGHMPDRGPGNAFIAIAHAGFGRHTKV